MSNGDSPAHPITDQPDGLSMGLTKRELIAAMAMQGYASNPNFHIDHPEYFQMRAKFAAQQADALLAELDKPKP